MCIVQDFLTFNLVERRLSLHYVSALLLIACDRASIANTRVNQESALPNIIQYIYITIIGIIDNLKKNLTLNYSSVLRERNSNAFMAHHFDLPPTMSEHLMLLTKNQGS